MQWHFINRYHFLLICMLFLEYHLSLTSLCKVCMSSQATSQLGLGLKEELDVEGRIEPMCGTAFPV